MLHGEAAPPLLQWHPATYQPVRELDTEHVVGVAAAGPHLTLRRASSQGQVVDVLTVDCRVTPALRVEIPAQIVFPAAPSRAGRITVHDGAGRVVAADLGTRRVVANLTVRG